MKVSLLALTALLGYALANPVAVPADAEPALATHKTHTHTRKSHVKPYVTHYEVLLFIKHNAALTISELIQRTRVPPELIPGRSTINIQRPTTHIILLNLLRRVFVQSSQW